MKIVVIRPKYLFLIAFFILLTSYSIFQARSYILGPQVWIDSPQDGQMVEDPLVILFGRSRNIAWISINDRQIFTDEDGKWSEKLIVSRGISIMTVRARDHFGRETEKKVRIVLK